MSYAIVRKKLKQHYLKLNNSHKYSHCRCYNVSRIVVLASKNKVLKLIRDKQKNDKRKRKPT